MAVGACSGGGARDIWANSSGTEKQSKRNTTAEAKGWRATEDMVHSRSGAKKYREGTPRHRSAGDSGGSGWLAG